VPPETPDLHGAFPRLGEEQLRALAARGERHHTQAGEVLYREGDAGYDLGRNMSRYLVDRVRRLPNVEVLLDTEVRELVGDDVLEAIVVENNRTGADVSGALGGGGAPPSPGRRPLLLETSRQGVFAAGDVRSGPVKRVASAVGEGAMAVRMVHQYLEQVGGPGR
jgi:thioredoxin reductase (NADPH)